MIVETMTAKEIYENLASDSEKVQIRKAYYRAKAIKCLKSKTTFPALVTFDYVHQQSKNKYILIYYAETRRDVNHPVEDSVFVQFIKGARCLYKAMGGLQSPADGGEPRLVRYLQIYTKHFMDRYKQRIWENHQHCLSDVSCAFIVRNQGFAPIVISSEINRNIEKYDESAQYGFRVRDGFCFTQSAIEVSNEGKSHVAVSVFKTFMNESDMQSTQLNAIEIEQTKQLNHLASDFNTYGQNGVLSLIVEE